MKVKEISRCIAEKYKTPTICDSCGDEFLCGATSEGCWCMNAKLNDEARAELESNFEGCLCQNCLEKYVVK